MTTTEAVDDGERRRRETTARGLVGSCVGDVVAVSEAEVRSSTMMTARGLVLSSLLSIDDDDAAGVVVSDDGDGEAKAILSTTRDGERACNRVVDIGREVEVVDDGEGEKRVGVVVGADADENMTLLVLSSATTVRPNKGYQ